MHFVKSKLLKGQLITGGNLRFSFITMRLKIHSPKISETSYYVSSASCQNHQHP
jgi:hypothetical protein